MERCKLTTDLGSGIWDLGSRICCPTKKGWLLVKKVVPPRTENSDPASTQNSS